MTSDEDNMNQEEKYIRFASTLSFFEFTQEEFHKPHFDVSDYSEELKKISTINNISIDELAAMIRLHPKLFDVFEEVFQLVRFTNTQLIHFLFDVDILNSRDINKQNNYLRKILHEDMLFKELFMKKESLLSDKDIMNEKSILLVKLFKEQVVEYVNKSTKDRNLIYNRVRTDISVSSRIAKYLINNLKLNEVLESTNVSSFLKFKRLPRDTKSIHGKFGIMKIRELLEQNNIINIDFELKRLGITSVDNDLIKENALHKYLNKTVFITEKYVNNIMKTKQKRSKKFDFIILKNLKIVYFIETNFYSTSGTKIGINEEEYIDLNDEIKSKMPSATFLWITDGNYWLSTEGEKMFYRNIQYFGDNILNYNLFNEKISNL